MLVVGRPDPDIQHLQYKHKMQQAIIQTSPSFISKTSAVDGFYSSASLSNQKALTVLSDYRTVKDLIFRTKQPKDVPGLKGAKLTAQDMDKNPLVLRNIFMALAERHELESKQVLSSQKLRVKQRKKLSEAHKVMADAFMMSASGLKPLSQVEQLKFGTRFYNGKSFGTRFAEANLIIHSFSAGAGATGFFLSPIPFAGPAALTAVTYAMLQKFGKKLYNENLGLSMGGLASMAGAALGPHLANQLWQLIPGVGQVILAASEGAASSLMHEALVGSTLPYLKLSLLMVDGHICQMH